MDRDRVIAACLAKPGAEETYPFGEDALVAKVGGKIFAIVSLSEPKVSLKCDPDWSLELREVYPAVEPGYHLDKRLWNTITLDGSVPGDELEEMIEHSYDLVVAKLTREERQQISDPGRR